MNTGPNDKLYGFYSDKAARGGTCDYLTPEGKTVTVTCVDRSPTGEGYAFSDMRALGEVTVCVRTRSQGGFSSSEPRWFEWRVRPSFYPGEPRK